MKSIQESNNKMNKNLSQNVMNPGTQPISASQRVRDVGENQSVEEHIAQVAFSSPLAIDASAQKTKFQKPFRTCFNRWRREILKYTSSSILQSWPLMFPCLLWNGKGGLNDCIHSKVSLREWVNYVIRIPSLNFRSNVIFISYANIILRRQRITGLTAHKLISKSVEEAVKELIQISHSSHSSSVPDSTLEALSKKVGTYVDQLPGSLYDMRKFRNDILSMMKKHGPPSYFLTLSSADSIWPEGFVAALNGKVTIEQAKRLSTSERAELMAENPVASHKLGKED